ncbi:unnamed protein product [Orchesella dallaii]|uniref:CARD domain-containing protein n=1 Tax=Orchesella dallaii TaxID=48710 RepID=A0ABP1PMA0_9HEXA
MEYWQDNVISENLTKLVELTDCSTGLLNRLKEQKVLSREDVEKISACKTELEKSDQLYKIIVKRANAFDILVKALEDTTQSGAAIILTTKSNRNVEKPVVNKEVTKS